MQQTNRILFKGHMDITSMQNSTDIMDILSLKLYKGIIAQFYKENGIRIETLTAKIQMLQRRYFIFEKNEAGQEQPKLTGEPGNRQPECNEGLKYEDYVKEYDEIMDKTVEINI